MEESKNRNKNIILDERQFGIVKEQMLITESQESKSIHAAKKLVMQRLGFDEDRADAFIRNDIRESFPALKTPQGGKFILGVVRMFLNMEFNDASTISDFDATLKLVSSDKHINEFDRNLNGMSCNELIQMFSREMSEILDADKKEVNSMKFTGSSDYDIVRIDSFEQASEYSKYTAWCVTNGKGAFDSNTNNGCKQFYFCLKHGFESVPARTGEGCPLDEYGLSMLAVLVNENGSLSSCTCRWNHANGGNGAVMNAKQISKVVGVNFYETFKPNNKWENILSDTMDRLAKGEDPKHVFDKCGDFEGGFAVVKLKNKWNFLTKNGNILSDTWFDYCFPFKYGFAFVELNDKWNYLTTDGKILSNTWFDDCYVFQDGFAIVELNGKRYKIDTNGAMEEDTLEERKTTNKNVMLTEEQFGMLNEGVETKNMSAAKHYIYNFLGRNDENKAMEIIGGIKHDIPNSRLAKCKFMLGVTRMYCDGEVKDAATISDLDATLELVASDKHINKFDRNLNGISCNELIQMFSKEMSEILDADKKEVNGMKFTEPSDYDIVRIDSFEQASEYRKYTDWCVTESEDAFDNYTSYGIKQFYFCLKHGFEGVPAQTGEGCPLDEYGLSMIAVLVNENGSLAHCTCRWNHANGGNDNVMKAKQVSKVVGVNFYETFKPNNKWEETLSDAMERLANGEVPEIVFDQFYDFEEGFAIVELNGKENFITTNGKLLSDTWFDECYNFENGIAIVCMNNKWNFLTMNGRLLSNTWFDRCYDFENGFVRVELNSKMNFLTMNGRLLSDTWFDRCSDFQGGLARVLLNHKWNFLTTDGRLLSDTWFDSCLPFENDIALVLLNYKWYKIDRNGVIKEGPLEEGKSTNKNVILTEEQFDIFRELILEGGDSRLKPIKNIIRTAFEGTALNPDAYVTSAEYQVPNRGEQTTWMHYLIYSLRHDFNLMGNSDVPMLKNVAKIAFLELNFEKGNQDLSKLNVFKKIVNLIKNDDKAKAEFIQSDNVTFSSVYEQYSGILQQMDDEQRNAVNSKTYENGSKYKITLIDDFNTARELGKYTGDGSEGRLCYTERVPTWNSFTNNGNNQCYLCYMPNYKEIPPQKGEGYPKDEYGLSMIWLFVDEKGNISNSNVRWNHGDHSYSNVDNIFTESEISDIVGVNFYETFKPNNKWEETLSDAMERLANGEGPETVFDQFYDSEEGFAIVGLNSKWNFITTNGKLLSDTWFDNCYDFKNDFARVELNNKRNFLSADGKILSDIWFDKCYDFRNGIASVELNNKENFVTTDGKLLSDTWFDICYNFENGFACVELNDKFNFVNTDGRLLSDTWFDNCSNFKNGFARVELKGRYNFLTMEGKILFNVWFDFCYDFENGFTRAKLSGEWYKISKNGVVIKEDSIGEGKRNRKPTLITKSDLHRIIKESVRLALKNAVI